MSDPGNIITLEGGVLQTVRRPYDFGIYSGFGSGFSVNYIWTTGGIMNAATQNINREFKVWMTATLGLIKDGRMGATQARAERIKAALAYARKGH